jgi:hypothetical protein
MALSPNLINEAMMPKQTNECLQRNMNSINDIYFKQHKIMASFIKFGESAITLAAYGGHFDIAELLPNTKVVAFLF